jgi:hypothetical protein
VRTILPWCIRFNEWRYFSAPERWSQNRTFNLDPSTLSIDHREREDVVKNQADTTTQGIMSAEGLLDNPALFNKGWKVISWPWLWSTWTWWHYIR